MDRAEFVQRCGDLLVIAKPHLVKCELVLGKDIPVSEINKPYEHYISEDEYVVITCKNGARYVRPIEGNNLNAIAEEIFHSMASK